MNIAQVSHLYRPSIGGIENYVHRLNRSVRAHDHESRTFTTDLSLSNGRAPVSDEPVRYCRTTLAPYRNPLSVELYREVKQTADDIDVFHLHSPWFLSTLASAFGLPDDQPTVMTVHSAEIANHRLTVRALNTGYRPFAKYIFNRVDRCIVQGESEKSRLISCFDVDDGQVEVIPNGIHFEEYDIDEDQINEFRSKYGIQTDVPTILFVSRLVPEKNPDVFVEAVGSIDDHGCQAVVIGSGDDEFATTLREQADDRVTFLSGLSFDELKAAYHAADLFVFLGTWEGLPTVILEAMNAELPIVSTGVGAIPDAVQDGEHGTIVPRSPDEEAVADAIRHYLDDPGLRKQIGERNRKYVRQHYGWEDLAERIIDTYEEVRS